MHPGWPCCTGCILGSRGERRDRGAVVLGAGAAGRLVTATRALTWRWVILVALAARMWRLIRLRRVVRLVRVWWGLLVSGTRKAAGSAALVLVDGAVPLRPEPALFEAMLEGWRRQQGARRLSGPLVEGRVRLVRRFAAFTGAWPWQWTPAQVEQRIASGGWAHSTVRSYEGALAVFLGYVCDSRYGWIAECEQQVGARPVQVCHEGNTAVHAAEYEGRPERRPLTRAELQAFLDAADDHVGRASQITPIPWPPSSALPGRCPSAGITPEHRRSFATYCRNWSKT